MNQLHPGARWVFRLRAYSALIPFAFFLVWFGFFAANMGSLFFTDSYGAIVASVIIGIFLFVLFVIVIGEIYARMAYTRYLYEITQDGVKIEKGIIWKKYTSIPYERIQNVDIRRGVIARMLGFSTVEIETAGRSGQFRGWHFGHRNQRYESEGHLTAMGIEDAEKIREFVMKKIKKSNSAAGLG
jgi:putative membrane protein